jgi:hypothetical protein
VHGALAYGADSCKFYPHADFVSGGLTYGQSAAVTVPTFSLGRLLARRAIDRCTLICDIEGGEIDLVSNEADILAAHACRLILELHPTVVGTAAVRSLLASLGCLGFVREHRSGDVYVFRNPALWKEPTGRSECQTTHK